MNHRHRGFTLIELTLALALSAMLAATLHTALSTAWRAKRTAEGAVEPTRAGAIAMEIISKDLAAAPSPPTTAVESSESTQPHLGGPFIGTHQSAGGGDNDDLEFHTISRDETADENDPMSDGFHLVQYHIRQDAGESVLVRSVVRNLLALQEQTPVDEVICRNVRGLSFRYYDGTDWQTDWDSTAMTDTLPVAVQVTIQFNDPRMTQSNPPGVREISAVVPLPCTKITPLTTSTSLTGS